jgi:hypothetical protein
MPQNPPYVFIQNPAGVQTALNVTTTGVLSAGQIVLGSIVVNAAGSAGDLTLNDCATLGAASAANVIYSCPYSNLKSQILNFPCQNGLVVSAIPTGAVINVALGAGVVV